MVLLLATGFTFAQEKSVKEAKSIANDVKPDFAQAEKLINEALNNADKAKENYRIIINNFADGQYFNEATAYVSTH